MYLSRNTPTWEWTEQAEEGSPFEKAASFDTYRIHFQNEGEKEFARVSFPRFGGGAQRKSDFAVLVSWEDVEQLIDKLCEIGEPKALAGREALKLAEAAKQ